MLKYLQDKNFDKINLFLFNPEYIEKQFLMQDNRLMFYLRPDVQAKEGYKKSFLNDAEYKVLMAILEQRNATQELQ